MQLKDLAFIPLYLYQGKKLQRSVIRLPEATGERHGRTVLSSSLTDTKSMQDDALNLMIIGDSSAAGVGVATQEDALLGYLLKELQQQPIINEHFCAVNWTLYATTGHTSFDILRRLYILPTPSAPVDVMVIVVGVNDATKDISAPRWQNQLKQIIAIAQRKFGAKRIVFCSLPPMAKMPALPTPLNQFIGAKATRLDKLLQQVCEQSDNVSYFGFDLDGFIKDTDTTKWFAKDGFHPSKLTYEQWGKQLADYLSTMLISELPSSLDDE